MFLTPHLLEQAAGTITDGLLAAAGIIAAGMIAAKLLEIAAARRIFRRRRR